MKIVVPSSAVAFLLGSACGDFSPGLEVSGRVFLDRDGDGRVSPGDEPLAGGHVFYETRLAGSIDSDGRYDLSKSPAVTGPGIVWVRPPAGSADPGPFWVRVDRKHSGGVDIPVRPLSGRGTFSFVAASDTHAGIGTMDPADQVFGLVQATAIEPRPYFVAVTGDITQSNKPEQFESVLAGIGAIDVPYVAVPGNHDWYDGGASYRRVFGPPNYSFDSGGMHFIVLNDADSLEERLAFVDADLSLVSGDPGVVVLMHAPPREDVVPELEVRGVDALLTGHLHANRVMLHGNAVEYNTQPLLMGGIDLTPGGYRVFTVADGRLVSQGRTTVNWPVVRLVAPSQDQLAPACAVQLIAAIEAGVSVRAVTAQVDRGAPVPLESVGGWNYASEVLEVCDPGPHAVDVTVELADDSSQTIGETIEVGEVPEVSGLADWPMLNGDVGHTGASPTAIVPPLRTRWVSSVGGHVHGGSPVIADGRVLVSVSDFGEGQLGGVVALDAGTGSRLWEARVGSSVRNAPAVSEGVVVFLSNDGEVHALEAATGRAMWSYELAPQDEPETRSAYSSPLIADGVVYAGVQRELAALDLATGVTRWTQDPTGAWGHLASHVSPAISGNALIVSFDRGQQGLIAFDLGSGGELWRTDGGISQHMHGSPVAADDQLFVVNELTEVAALNPADGSVRWRRQLSGDAFYWSYLSAATPTYWSGMLFVGVQLGDLVALETGSGNEVWRYTGAPSMIRATHYHGQVPAFPAAPAVTPGALWTGSPDGVLRALDPATGALLWSYELGVPITASPAPAGKVLVVASYDGTVRALSAE